MNWETGSHQTPHLPGTWFSSLRNIKTWISFVYKPLGLWYSIAASPKDQDKSRNHHDTPEDTLFGQRCYCHLRFNSPGNRGLLKTKITPLWLTFYLARVQRESRNGRIPLEFLTNLIFILSPLFFFFFFFYFLITEPCHSNRYQLGQWKDIPCCSSHLQQKPSQRQPSNGLTAGEWRSTYLLQDQA